MTSERVVFDRVANRIIDFIKDGADEAATLAAFKIAYGSDLVVLDYADAYARYENSFRSPPAEISEDRFIEMLAILPPVNLTVRNGGMTFKLAERTAGAITSIFAEIGGRHFELQDSLFLNHDDILALVKDSKAFRESKEGDTPFPSL